MPESLDQNTISAPSAKKRQGRGMRFIVNVILIIAVIAAAVLFARAEMERRKVAAELKKTTTELEEIKKSTTGSGEEVAKMVLEKARQHIDIPADPAPTVATIVDVNKLREASEFYKVAENGDHLIITGKRAILFSSKRNLVLDVVPVQLDKTSPQPTPKGTTTPAARVSTAPAASVAP